MPHAIGDAVPEGIRILTICNACRYCEGYCAVFPALERRTDLGAPDLHHLANLCHNCAECYYACQYAPPHEFAVNVPKTLAEIRLSTYSAYAWPGSLRDLFRSGLTYRVPVLLTAIGVIIAAAIGLHPVARGAGFYQVVSHGAMVAIFGTASIIILLALFAGLVRFWKGTGPTPGSPTAAIADALRSVLLLENLSSHGSGCTYPAEHHSQSRRWFHHFTFYGFALCFASTSAAAFYHYVLGLNAPYAVSSLPVVLGALGGLGLLIGPVGLYRLKKRRNPMIVDTSQDTLDLIFLSLLFGTSLTGLVLLILRRSVFMPALLVVHLAIVLALFASLPYGKFVHGLYRAAALWRDAMETRAARRKLPQSN
ncbi:MAG: tricarballylate utilization 4Fe-4S protein TcuB [Acidobacteriia bacterium]|nr:tricarballylate utilization 4Fe-4S protein TcuB [Terriglobia bacterium]